MPHASSEGIRIHYRVEGEGPPLVLQHGFTSSLKSWYANGYVEPLKREYRLILVDARGHGASDKPHDPASYTLSSQAADVVAVLEALSIRSAHYWGYSMGGLIGFGLAKFAPERIRSLIIGGAHPYGRLLPGESRSDGSDPEEFVAALYGRLGVDVSSFPPGRRDELFSNDFRALAAAQQDRPSVEEILPNMAMPCLLYASDADPVYPKVRACAERIPHAVFFALQGLDHSETFRQSGLVLPHIREFLPGGGKGVRNT